MGNAHEFIYGPQALDFIQNCSELNVEYQNQIELFESVIRQFPEAGVAIPRPPITIYRLDVPPPKRNGLESLAFHYQMGRYLSGDVKIRVNFIEYSKETEFFPYHNVPDPEDPDIDEL